MYAAEQSKQSETTSTTSLIPVFTDEIAAMAANEFLRIKQEDNVIIRDLEHLYYYREFRRIFPTDEEVGVPRFSTDPCIGCGFQVHYIPFIHFCDHYYHVFCTLSLKFHSSFTPFYEQLKSPTEMFCHICGAWPARSPLEG